MEAIEQEHYIGDKLRELLARLGISQRKLAKLTGYTQQYINQLANNKSRASVRAIKKLSQALGVSPSYFLEEEPPKEYPPPPDVVEREYVPIPKITGVGAGGEVITDDYTLIKRSRLSRKSVSAFDVLGDSMEPTIPKGWTVLIDPNDKELVEGGIYLFAVSYGNSENGLIIRRVHKVNDEWELVPDNRKYAPQKLTGDYKIIGRVLKKLPPNEPMDVE